MTCEERKDQIGLYAMNALDPEERSELRAHLQSGCPACNGYRAEVEALLDLLPLALTPVDPGPDVRSRLMDRISVRRSASPLSTVEPKHPRRMGRLFDAMLGGAIAAAVAAFAVWMLLGRDRAAIQSLQAQVARHDSELGSLQTSVQSTDQTLRVLQSPAVQVVSAEGTAAQPTALARVFLDRPRGTVYFYAAGLKPLAKDKTYELWLINDQKKAIPFGTFDVNSLGEASVQRNLPADAGRIAVVAVTDEPTGGVPQPTGSIQLKGAIQ